MLISFKIFYLFKFINIFTKSSSEILENLILVNLIYGLILLNISERLYSLLNLNQSNLKVELLIEINNFYALISLVIEILIY